MPRVLKSRSTKRSSRAQAQLPSGRGSAVHPGEILKETLDDLGISMNRFAQEIRVPANRISTIVAGTRSVTGETALRLARYFGTTPTYWMNMQTRYDLESARDEWEARIALEVRPRDAA